jgi:FAD/FMN-containing dehydrogenase
MNNLIEKIVTELGAGIVLTGADVEERYAVDWSRENPCKPEVVLRPRSTEDVSAILKLCNDAAQPIVTQGGMTGLVGGATPRPAEWALSMERMNGVVELDVDSMTLTAKAGTPLEKLQHAARDAGFLLPLDLGARGSCTIGGNIATNAGGNQVIQYGMARSLVLGLVAVMADGTVISSKNKLLKNNTGFDLKHLFIGSEGALGVVTEVVLRLFPAHSSRQSALCGLTEFADVVRFLQAMKRRLSVVSSYEVMWENYYRYAIDHVDYTRDPFEDKHNFYVLVESEGNDPEQDERRFQSALFEELENGTLKDVIIAQSLQDREDFWAIRDSVGEILRSLKDEANFDIGIPLNETESCMEKIEAALKAEYGELVYMVFGHLGDGNLHVIATTGKKEHKKNIYDIVYRITGEHHGGIAAEHGIGMLKKPWLHLSRSEQEISLMRQLKQTLDPNNILNPGRVI